MTVLTTIAKAGPYAGAGTTGPFAVPFRFLAASHLRVIKTSTAGLDSDLVLTADYTVAGVGAASGSVTLTAPLAVGEKLTAIRNVPATQEADYVGGDAFPAESHEEALDKLTMLVQQNAEELARAVKVAPTSTEDPALLIASLRQSEQNAAASASAAAASFDDFDDRYLGAKASDPTVDNDGNPLQVGALYWSTSLNRIRAYNGSVWTDTATASPASFTSQTFNGNGSQTAFTLSQVPASTASVLVFISGESRVPVVDYTISGTTLTFAVAPPLGTGNIAVLVASTVAGAVPPDDSVSTAKIQDNAVSFAKLQNIATARLLGRATAGTGDGEELTGAQAQSLLPVQQTRVDVASAATVNLTTGAANTDHINITGTTTITGFTVAAGRLIFVRFAGALTLTNNASIVTQTGANILTQAGDTCILRATAASTVEVLAYREGRWAAVEGSAPMYACRAWVNFNGTGTVAIRASGNVSSITDNGTGDYTVNFTTTMPDANYSVVIGQNRSSGVSTTGTFGYRNTSTTSVRVIMATTAALEDAFSASVSIFR